MGLPASIPNEPLAGVAAEPAEWRALQREGRQLVDDVRKAPPAEGSAEESVALARLARFGLRSLRVLGMAFLDVIRGQLHASLAGLVQKELDAAEADRKLALRHIQQAVHRYGVVTETLWASLGRVSPSLLDDLVRVWGESIESGITSFTDEERAVARFQLDVLVALAVLDAPLEELTRWAFRAINGARRVEALAGRATEAYQLGELARIRTRRAWSDWSPSDVADEVAPWTRS
ncbi:MAG: hypothetical protein HYV09_20765 [Deltaproteobacteria bacterium]|nr:hypothetical protein [Deltaproteobacteria bacterium]